MSLSIDSRRRAVQLPGEEEMTGDARSPRPRRRRRTIAAAAVFIIVAAGAGALLWWWIAGREAAPDRLVLYGNVDIREVQPAFNDTGPIERMLVHEGDTVAKGQLIATLDDRRYAAALAQAEAQMRNQEQVLAKLVAGSRPEDIAHDKAAMDALQVTAENARTNYMRAENLARTGAGSVQQRDNDKAAFDAAQQQYEAARQTYRLAVLGPRQEDIAAARASYQAAQAAVALARRELDDTKLYAPSDGVVENRILEPGDMASPTTPVYTIALTNPLWVRAYVGETDLGKLALGMAAAVTTDSFPGQVYGAWVGYISPTAEFTPKSVETPQLRTALVYQVRVYVCDTRNQLRLGMPATVTIDLSHPASRPPGCGPAHDKG
jgi:membrane fusion protein YbhG